jgi:hypothetical protein
MTTAAVLIADISGSTPLYERDGNERALQEIDQCLNRLQAVIHREGGEYVSSKGDDVLCLFDDADLAFLVARQMLAEGPSHVLSIHAGLYWGDLLRLGGNVYGKPVYTAARLAALAKPGELLLGDTAFVRLSPAERGRLSDIGAVHLKGKAAPSEVYSWLAADVSQLTEVEAVPARTAARGARSVVLRFGGVVWRIGEGETLSVGRAQACDLVVPEPFVSRRHGTIAVARGLVEFTDHSSTGSFVVAGDGREYELFRRTMVLSGEGAISLGEAGGGNGAATFRFFVETVGGG